MPLSITTLCCYAECPVLFIVNQNVFTPSVIILIVGMLIVMVTKTLKAFYICINFVTLKKCICDM
jgi:hypothetical protein